MKPAESSDPPPPLLPPVVLVAVATLAPPHTSSSDASLGREAVGGGYNNPLLGFLRCFLCSG